MEYNRENFLEEKMSYTERVRQTDAHTYAYRTVQINKYQGNKRI